MRRALFIAIIAMAFISCNNSGSAGGASDTSANNAAGMDTMNGTGIGTDTNMMNNGSGTNTGVDTSARY